MSNQAKATTKKSNENKSLGRKKCDSNLKKSENISSEDETVKIDSTVSQEPENEVNIALITLLCSLLTIFYRNCLVSQLS